MTTRFAGLASATFLALALTVTSSAATRAGDVTMAENGLVKVKSAYSLDESVTRIKADIAAKGIMFFMAVDQSKLAADANIALRPSTLLIFGNPPLGTQFMTSNPESGLDWPVRLLVFQDAAGQVWAVYNDFGWIAARHGIKDCDAQFTMASTVIASITSSVQAK
jgi:uncharacterized protein (DUF302 family)